MKLQDFYDSTAHIYDLHYGAEESHANKSFYGELAREHGGPILEPACGTGKLAIWLATQGYEIVGLDISNRMLEVARTKAQKLPEEATNRISFFQADFSDFSLDKQFRLILIPNNSFVLAESETIQLNALQCFYAHLQNNGTLVIDLRFLTGDNKSAGTPFFDDLMVDTERNRTYTHTITRKFDPKANLIHFVHVIHEYDSENNVKGWVSENTMRCLTADGFREMLRQSGFQISAEYGGVDKSPFSKGRGRMVVIAEKHEQQSNLFLAARDGRR